MTTEPSDAGVALYGGYTREQLVALSHKKYTHGRAMSLSEARIALLLEHRPTTAAQARALPGIGVSTVEMLVHAKFIAPDEPEPPQVELQPPRRAYPELPLPPTPVARPEPLAPRTTDVAVLPIVHAPKESPHMASAPLNGMPPLPPTEETDSFRLPKDLTDRQRRTHLASAISRRGDDYALTILTDIALSMSRDRMAHDITSIPRTMDALDLLKRTLLERI